jgi:hypothetical protein
MDAADDPRAWKGAPVTASFARNPLHQREGSDDDVYLGHVKRALGVG